MDVYRRPTSPPQNTLIDDYLMGKRYGSQICQDPSEPASRWPLNFLQKWLHKRKPEREPARAFQSRRIESEWYYGIARGNWNYMGREKGHNKEREQEKVTVQTRKDRWDLKPEPKRTRLRRQMNGRNMKKTTWGIRSRIDKETFFRDDSSFFSRSMTATTTTKEMTEKNDD